MKRFLVIVVLAMIVSGCGTSCLTDRDRSGVGSLEKNWQLWRDQHRQNYVMQVNKGCLCDRGPVRITVVNGEIVLIQKVADDGFIVGEVPAVRYTEYFTIDGLFAEIARLDKEVDRLDVEYDPEQGFPNYIYVDPYGTRCDCFGRCSDAIDDEYSYSIRLE